MVFLWSSFTYRKKLNSVPIILIFSTRWYLSLFGHLSGFWEKVYLSTFFAIFLGFLRITFDTIIFAVKDGGHKWSLIPGPTTTVRKTARKLTLSEKKFVPLFSNFLTKFSTVTLNLNFFTLNWKSKKIQKMPKKKKVKKK